MNVKTKAQESKVIHPKISQQRRGTAWIQTPNDPLTLLEGVEKAGFTPLSNDLRYLGKLRRISNNLTSALLFGNYSQSHPAHLGSTIDS